MQTKEAILYVLNSARYVTNVYLSDLSDHDLLVRPTPAAHHIAWQLGHLLLSEAMMANAVRSGAGIALPAGFEALHSTPKRLAAPSDSHFNHPHANDEEMHDEETRGFYTKEQYTDLRTRQRERTLDLVASISIDDLAAPGPEKMRSYAPTKGVVLLTIGTHEMMHSGQWAVVRRHLNKPVVV